MPKKVLVPIANGSEDIETVCLVDTLRRAGLEVVVASVQSLQIKAARGTFIVADNLINHQKCLGTEWDCIALPGGMPGAEHLRDSVELTNLLRGQVQSGRLYGAICASPAVVLEHHGLLAGKRATCYPAMLERLSNAAGIDERVVVDGNCVTSQGPGSAIEFSLKLVELLVDGETAGKVGSDMLVFLNSD